jgi:5-methylcytosine-specific restriction endonuclease McrA
MKFCPKCSQTKSKLEFCKDRSALDGLQRLCMACQAKYRSENKEKISQSHAKYRSENKEKISQYHAKYRSENKERVAETAAKWRSLNKEKVATYGPARCSKRRASKLKASPIWADQEQIRLIYAYRSFLEKSTGIKHHVDHIVPLQNKYVCGLHNEFNLRVVPAKENLRKKNKFVDEPDFIHPDINNFALMTLTTKFEALVYQINCKRELV